MPFTRAAYYARWPVLSKEERFAKLKAKCKEMPSGCWEFQGYCGKPPRNYGHSSIKHKPIASHRLAYLLAKGEIPKGMIVMHSCDNPPCCNPDHLTLGTHLQNMAACRARDRYYYANLTQCKRGHVFDEENTYVIKTPGKWFGLRSCNACQRGYSRIKAGWPEHLAFQNIKIPRGYAIDKQTGEVISTKLLKNRTATVGASHE